MNLFPIPEDVAYELGRTDIDYDCDDVPRLNRVCKLCGADGLMWVRHELEAGSGWVLAYSYGPLANKLHACESKYRP
jgi:hypothetical protein